MYPKDYLYSSHHVWIDQTGDIATIGITSYASDELEDIDNANTFHAKVLVAKLTCKLLKLSPLVAV